MKLYCHSCGAEMDDAARFCEKCGREVQDSAERWVKATAETPMTHCKKSHPTAPGGCDLFYSTSRRGAAHYSSAAQSMLYA